MIPVLSPHKLVEIRLRAVQTSFGYHAGFSPTHPTQGRNLYFRRMTLRIRRGDTLVRPSGRILALVFEEAPVTSLSER